MSLLSQVTELLKRSTAPYETGRFVVVPTLLSYESGRVVQAYIEGGVDRFVVSDSGAALFDFANVGGKGTGTLRHARHISASYGLGVNDDGWVHSKVITGDHLPTYIALVAECSVAIDGMLKRLAKKQREVRDFKETVNAELRKDIARPVVRRKHLFGASNKQHVFDFGVELQGDRTLVMDAVVADPNSINSAVVAHMDIKQSGNPRVEQLIVFDDAQKWTGSDLSLLAIGATTIPFSSLPHRLVGMGAVH